MSGVRPEASGSFAHSPCFVRLLASVTPLVLRYPLAGVGEVLDEQSELVRGLLLRIARRPGRTSWGGQHQLRWLWLRADRRDGSLEDQPFFVLSDQRLLLGKLAQSERHRRTPRSDQPSQYLMREREWQPDPGWGDASPGFSQ